LIFTLLFIQGGIIVFFIGSQQMVLKAYISLKQSSSKPAQLDTFYFSQSTFDSLKIDAKEFKYSGEMYDIEKAHYFDGQVKVIAHKDIFEQNILSLINSWHDSDPKKSSIPSLIKKITSLIYIIEQGPLFKDQIQKSIPQSDFCYNENNCKDVFFDVIKPPCNA
jgi:hypothetical protein